MTHKHQSSNFEQFVDITFTYNIFRSCEYSSKTAIIIYLLSEDASDITISYVVLKTKYYVSCKTNYRRKFIDLFYSKNPFFAQ